MKNLDNYTNVKYNKFTENTGGDMANETAASNIIENRIYTIRGQKVMLDRDLAELYEV
jgi:hypothetical protein